ncbi:DEAD/DEAH box helicase [Streptomyces flavidovirens]|uniref:DEAD/DEAH box helicase n=1 Tax=Streptomyces flavidovirens TaxID=67298 RepID=UPI001FCC09DF|nr:DEAD/DEAH box helicase [Streptomyces flavidovirens]
MRESKEETVPVTVGELVRQRWGTVLDEEDVLARFREPGWSYQEQVLRSCPACETPLHSLRRPYESAGRQYRYVAVVCPACPRAYTLADLGVKTYDKLTTLPGARAAVTAPAMSTPPRRATSTPAVLPKPAAGLLLGPRTSGPGVTVTAIGSVPPGTSPTSQPAPVWPPDLPLPAETEKRALLWCKVTDPGWRPSKQALTAAEDIRAITPAEPEFDPLRAFLTDHGGRVRRAGHWVEAEQISTVGDLGNPTDLTTRPLNAGAPAAGPAAYAARDAFAAQWDALADLPSNEMATYVPVTSLVPADWQRLLPHPAFNPVQAAAIPAILENNEHTVIVAPTGAGKTAIGMVAALQTHTRGRKAAWLVPQRSLTDELDRDLETWRSAGRTVVRLTGEYAVDAELIRTADLWVATTEKFEAISRTGSLRAALAEVGCLIVDEIHLLGDPTRGPVLEALLARVREDSTQVRIVGLSATVANAEQVADWLGARLIRSPWRPTRLTWQLPVLPEAADNPDWKTRAQIRTAHTVRLARGFTETHGSVLVFCGSKRGVRATALALAADRGVPAKGADADDSELVERLCTRAGVRLHYRDWPYKREAEQAFRTRQADILVATSTVAAGVNLPARAVIVRDTQVGMDRIEVSMVQQMFGRAGRVGAGEREGFAYLLTGPAQRAEWQARLAAGYTVTSRIRDHLPDHVLAEAVQGRLADLDQAETWWTKTFAHHQGHHHLDPLHDALDFLHDAGYLHRTPDPGGNDRLTITETGKLTSRFMVESDVATTLTDVLRLLPAPDNPDDAEDTLITLLSTRLPVLEQAPFTDRAKTALYQVLRTGGHTDAPDTPRTPQDEQEDKPAAGDLARAVLLLVANSPKAFRTRSSYILGIPVDSMAQILDEARRYLAWLAAQGQLGTIHPWAAVVAADLTQRIRWRTLGPRRGSGRLLWMCERMATPAHAHHLVPLMWRAARQRGIDAPDWPGTTPPSTCRLHPDDYRALLATRTTGIDLDHHPDSIRIRAPRGTQVHLWTDPMVARHTSDGTTTDLPYPLPGPGSATSGHNRGGAVFTRGDHLGIGWLSAYNAIGPRK